MKINRQILRILLVISLFWILPGKAEAAKQDAELAISAVYDHIPLEGMEFFAYLIPETEISGKEISAEELERQLIMAGTAPDRSEKTDKNGNAVFQDMNPGIYLIRSAGLEKEGSVYLSSAFLTELPQKEDGSLNYQVSAKAKLSKSDVTADLEVVKIWKDDCHKNARPQSISIELFCDGKLYDTISLPKDGRWQYTWKGLAVNHHWTVSEAQQEGYAVPEIEKDGNRFIVTNICSKVQGSGKPSLPQTGQLWWPVPVLFCGGVLLITAGLRKRKGD